MNVVPTASPTFYPTESRALKLLSGKISVRELLRSFQVPSVGTRPRHVRFAASVPRRAGRRTLDFAAPSAVAIDFPTKLPVTAKEVSILRAFVRDEINGILYDDEHRK